MPEPRPPDTDDASRRTWFVDLTLGSWRPREAATQLALALGVELAPLPRAEPDRGALAGARRAIDVEAAGDPIVGRAHDDASRVAPALWSGALVAILVPRYGLPLRVEDEWFIFLLRKIGVPILTVGDELTLSVGKTMFERRRIPVPELPARPWLPADQLALLRFFPGLLPKSLAAAAGINVADAELIPLGADHYLIPLNYRDADAAVSARDFDAMEALERLDDGLLALAQTYCTGYFADVGLICDLARHCLQVGSADLADGLATRARLVARVPADMARADLVRQEIRLAAHRFLEMEGAPPSSLRAPAASRAGLQRLQVAGAVFAGETAAAEAALEPMVASLKDESPLAPDDLLVLGALGEARAGKRDVGGGYFLAEAVSAALARDPASDQRLVFRSRIGLAGIHRFRANLPDQRAALIAAYETSRGARTLHELVELNALLAGIEEDTQSDAARHAWLRASLAWLALDPPEALSRRAMEILKIADSARAQLDLDASDALADALEASWPGLPVTQRQRSPVVRGLGRASPKPERALGGPGAGVFWSASAEIAAVYARPRQRLIRLVLAALASLAPPLAGVVTGTILIDTNLGTDIPATREELLGVALRANAGELVFGDEVLFLDGDLRPRLAAELRVRLSPIVQSVVPEGDRRIVRFRRHLAAVTLAAGEARIVDELADGKTLTLAAMAVLRGESHPEAEAALRRLEAARVIRLDAVAR